MSLELPSIQEEVGSLFDRYVIPPTTVLDSNMGYWRKRKDLWKALGISDNEGREEGLTFNTKSSGFVKQQIDKVGSTSSFDPVLCEMMYRWFTPNNSTILDPFAGGSTRGVVAGRLGREYVGIDLRAEQIEVNNRQRGAICPDAKVRWICGDSLDLPTLLPEGQGYDFVFSCPPYGDLEQYSKDPKDLSNMGLDEFRSAYAQIIKNAVAKLAEDRFAAFVVGNYRRRGMLVDFVGDTVRAFEEAGAPYYNQFILVNPVATLRFRLASAFDASRKAGMRHQHVLVFVKGDPKKATLHAGTVDTVYPGGVFDGEAEEEAEDFFSSL